MNDLNSKVKKSSRRLAFEALFDVFFKDAYTNIIIRQIIRHNELSLVDKRLFTELVYGCLLYTSPSPRDKRQSRMPSSA